MLGLGRCLQGRASDSPNAVPVSVDCLPSHMLPIVALSFESHESESVQQIYSLDLSIEYCKCLHGGSEHYDLVHWHNLNFRYVWIGIWIGCLVLKEVPTQPCGLTVCAFKILT